MINLYVKFNVHSTYAKQFIVLKVADSRTDGRTDAPDASFLGCAVTLVVHPGPARPNYMYCQHSLHYPNVESKTIALPIICSVDPSR